MTMSLAKQAALVAALAASAAASSCSMFGGAMGGGAAPDEFRVVTRAPLQLPPDYSLRPPRPGEPRPQELQSNEEARTALFGQDVGRDATEGERGLVARAGAEAVDANIRQQVDFEGANLVHRSEQFSDRIIQFQGAEADAANPAGVTPERRTQEQEAIRRATGGAAVTIERRETGFKLPGT